MDPVQEKDVDPRIDLAIERTELALERTQLAGSNCARAYRFRRRH